MLGSRTQNTIALSRTISFSLLHHHDLGVQCFHSRRPPRRLLASLSPCLPVQTPARPDPSAETSRPWAVWFAVEPAV